MAEALTSLLGDALVAMFDWITPRFEAAVDAAASFVANAARPDPPMSIRTLEGEIVTGVLVVDRGEVIAFIGVCRPPSVPRHRSHDEPLWPRTDLYTTR